MRASNKRYLSVGLCALLALGAWVFSVVVISAFKSQECWDEAVSDVAYAGFWTSPTQFAVLIPLFIAVAVLFTVLAVQSALSESTKDGIVERICKMRLTPRVIAYVVLSVLAAALTFLEYVNLSMVYVVWDKGQFQSMWNAGNVSCGIAICTSLFVVIAYALAFLIKTHIKKRP